MARLLSYRRKDENRYSTFCDVNVSFGKSTDNLMIKTVPKAKMSSPSPSVHHNRRHVTEEEKRNQKKKGSSSLPSLPKIKSRKRIREWLSRHFLPPIPHRKWLRKFFCCCFIMSTCRCCKRDEVFDNEDDIDNAVEEYRKKQQQNNDNGGQNKSSSLKSNQSDNSGGGGGRVIWKWDESWKSNSDKFLEALESEGVGGISSDRTLERKASNLCFKNSKVRKSAMFNNYIYGGGFLYNFTCVSTLYKYIINN